MDQRHTLRKHEDFHSLLQAAFAQHQTVHLLFDCMGMERRSGRVAALTLEEEQPYLILEAQEEPIYLHEIVAVNGMFRDDFTEC